MRNIFKSRSAINSLVQRGDVKPEFGVPTDGAARYGYRVGDIERINKLMSKIDSRYENRELVGDLRLWVEIWPDEIFYQVFKYGYMHMARKKTDKTLGNNDIDIYRTIVVSTGLSEDKIQDVMKIIFE